MTIGISAFLLALMPNARGCRPGFLRRSLSFSVPAGLIVAAALLALNTYAGASGIAGETGPEAQRAASVLTLFMIGLWILAVVSRPPDARKLAVVVAMCASLVILLNLPLAEESFNLAWPPAELLQAAVLTGAGGGIAIELLAWIHGRKFPR